MFTLSVHNISSENWNKLQKWFNLGVFATVVLVPVSIVLLLVSNINALKEGKSKSTEQALVLEPMIPGVNLPLSDIGYYFVTIALCSMVHEIGHAMAAFKEGVHVFGVGLVIIFIVPVAFVKINSEEVAALHPLRQLRIFCAGIWHNVIVSLLAYIFLISYPFLLSPLYDLGRGVYVLNVKENSKVAGISGIFPGDKLVAINDCEVSDLETWHQCLISFTNKPPPGYCVSEDIIHQLDESVPMKVSNDGTVECCENTNEAHLCFETLEDGAPLQILQYSCLPGRPIIAGTAYMCQSPKECPPGLYCVRPVTPEGTTLLRIQRSKGNVVIFIGNPKHIIMTVSVSDYSQIFDMFPSKLPEVLIRLTKNASIHY
ncbi:hypothetical protein RUM44_012495 [Polyplax serrata]|uniref:Membrane-bound transcription factor site-2 protease n=1 Tax=Polyplax serrata TaxID=468196 RepID=A0ABR1BBG6_POLSC